MTHGQEALHRMLGRMYLEHGIGGSRDLPIPLPLALAGAGAALAVSFTVLAVAWRTPRFDAATHGRPLPRVQRVVDGSWFSLAVRLLGLAFFGYVVFAAVAGQDKLTNPTFGVVYVLLWVGLVPASVLFGPFYRAVNPVRTLHLLFSKATGGSPSDGLFTLPRWVGLWPGAFGLLAFTWLELVYPESTYLSPVRFWFAAYIAIVVVGAAIFGDEWIASADPFEVYSTLVGHLSVFGRTADGRLVLRSPLGNLDGVPQTPGLLAVVGVLFGSTAFDSFKDSLTWLRFAQNVDMNKTWLNAIALVTFCLVVMGTFALASMLTGIGDDLVRTSLPGRFAHAVTPIIIGYISAHYLSYFVEVGQQTLIQLSDPLSNGANYLGTANWQINYFISIHTTLLACLKVGLVVTGHVLGVIASHDRAIKLLPKRHQLTGQLPMLFVMVLYTVTGLYLLLSA